MAPAVPPIGELCAPSHWRTADFISDLHLQAEEPATFEAWRRYMRDTDAHAVFILGDLFEVWVGDDAALEPGFAADCAAVLRDTALKRAVFFMHGNRDFLVGDGLLGSCGVTMLADPTLLDFAGRRWLLTHGDALCLDDVSYLRFREQVRQPRWQSDFLARPLAERQAIAADLRRQSEERKASDVPYGDIDLPAALAWMEAAGTSTLIHGHTHRPADHAMAAGRGRIVLSDWDATTSPPRLEVLRLTAEGARRIGLA